MTSTLFNRTVIGLTFTGFFVVLAGCGFEPEEDPNYQVSEVEVEQPMAGESLNGGETWETHREPLPEPASPLKLVVSSRLELPPEEGGTRESELEFHVHEDGRIWMGGTSQQSDVSRNVELHWDPPRYRFLRDGELVAAGEGNPFRAVMDLLPGFETFTLPYLIGLNPLGIDPQDVERENNRWTGPRGRMEIEDGVVRSLQGVPQLLHERYGVFGVSLTYEESVVDQERPEAESLTDPVVTEDHIEAVSGRVGSRVPDHEFETLDGEPSRLGDFNQPLLVNIWATWCPPCVYEIPELNELYERYEGRVEFVGISSERTQTIRAFQEDVPIEYHSWRHEGVLPQPYGATPHLPTTYLLDEELRIRHVIRGARTAEEFEELINRNLL